MTIHGADFRVGLAGMHSSAQVERPVQLDQEELTHSSSMKRREGKDANGLRKAGR